MSKSIFVNDDTYWYLKRYKNLKRIKNNDQVLLRLLDVIKDKPDRHTVIFDVKERLKFPQTKNGWTVQDEEIYWKIEEYAASCKLKFQDLAIFNLVGHCQQIEGKW